MAEDIPAAARPGVWVGASIALGREVNVTEERYPHICGVSVVGRMTQRRYRLMARDCAACAEKARSDD